MTRRILVSVMAAASLLSADTVVLRNGNRLEGSFIGGDNQSIRFAVGRDVRMFYLSEVESLRFTGGMQNAPSANYPPSQGQPYPSGQSYPSAQTYPSEQPYPAGQSYPAPAGAYPPAQSNANNYPQTSSYPPSSTAGPSGAPSYGPSGLEVAAGTPIVVRMIDGVDSQRDNLGQTFRASIDQPVVVNGQTVIPRGADVVATLIDAKQSGKIEGRTILTLDLKTVSANGRNYEIVTTGVSEASGSRGERSAKVIGGTAALGAIIGGIAGGGRGAAIGAGSGAAVGTAAEVATSGQKVKIPAETRLTFTLQNPIDF